MNGFFVFTLQNMVTFTYNINPYRQNQVILTYFGPNFGPKILVRDKKKNLNYMFLRILYDCYLITFLVFTNIFSILHPIWILHTIISRRPKFGHFEVFGTQF